jgi:hypothetical protein
MEPQGLPLPAILAMGIQYSYASRDRKLKRRSEVRISNSGSHVAATAPDVLGKRFAVFLRSGEFPDADSPAFVTGV